ncbi:MAG: hypothetical protein Q8O40_08055, partial [Chloroflexota bacterium]|nr:hypothetical protein [Chloroflexota bacterium]
MTSAISGLEVGDIIQWGSSATTQRGQVTGLAGSDETLTVQDVEGTSNDAPVNGVAVREVLTNASLPGWTPVLNSTHTITGGDLYLVDLEGYTLNVLVTLYITNPDELAIDYSYLNQLINVYVLCDETTGPCATKPPFNISTTKGVWGQATDAAGTAINAVADYMTLSSGYITFILKGDYEYAISVDGGVGYTIGAA